MTTEEKTVEQMNRIRAIREQLIALLHVDAVTREDVALALAQICPDKSGEELRRACEKMEEGIRNGTAEMKYYTELGDVDSLIQEKLAECTKQMSEAQKKGFLMSLYQIMHKDLAYADMSGEMARFLAELPEEEMREGLYQILYGETCMIAAREMEEFLKAAERELTEEKIPWNENWSREDQMLVTAASIYAASATGTVDSQLALYPEVIGRDVGAEAEAVAEIAKLGEEHTSEAVEMIILVVEILVIMLLYSACAFGTVALADFLYNLLIVKSVSTPLIVLSGVGLTVLGTAGMIAAVWGVSEAFEKLQVFAAEKAVPKAREVYQGIREKIRIRKETARAERAQKNTPVREAGFDEYDEVIEDIWNSEEEPLWEG